MEKQFDFMKNTPYQEIYEQMVKSEEYRDLLGTLVLMQTDRGVKLETARENADKIVEAVCAWEGVQDAVSENAADVVDQLLEAAKKEKDPELTLHKLYFGLTVHQSEGAINIIEGSTTVEDQFWAYYHENKDLKSLQQLEADVRQAVNGYDVSPDVMKAWARKLAITGDYLASAKALGEGGLNFKCIASMQQYLNGGGKLSISEAANLGCSGVQMQAACHAVGEGMTTRDIAKKILIVAGITVVVVGIAVAIYHAGGVVAMKKASKAAVDFILPMPEVFAAEFGSEIVVTSAESIRASYVPLIKAAEKKELIGGIVLALGAGLLAVSKKAAALLGKFRVGFTENRAAVAQGAEIMADHVRKETRAEVKLAQEATAEETAHQAFHKNARATVDAV